jgi:DNA-binding Lrp family transcriptional regulator
MKSKVPAPGDPGPSGSGQWMPLRDAAARIGVPELTLRRRCERLLRKCRAADPGALIEFDGLRARKFGQRWQIYLDRGWASPSSAPTT